jgi:hypothetical protein
MRFSQYKIFHTVFLENLLLNLKINKKKSDFLFFSRDNNILNGGNGVVLLFPLYVCYGLV